MVEGVVVASWVVGQVLACWNISLLVSALLFFLLSWLVENDVVGGWRSLVMQVHIGVHVVSIKVVDVFVAMAVSMGVWEAVSWLNIGLVVEIVWGFVVVVSVVWVHIMLLWVKGCVLNIVVLNSVMDLSLEIVEKLIIRVLNIVDHLSTEVILGVMAILITCVVGMGWSIMLEVL